MIECKQKEVFTLAKPLSYEKRADIIGHYQEGVDNKDISKWLRVTVRSVQRIVKLFKTTGNFEPKPQNSGRKPLVSDETMSKVVNRIKIEPDVTLLEIIEDFKLPISESALCKRLIKLGFTYKKRLSIQKNKSEPTSKKSGYNLLKSLKK